MNTDFCTIVFADGTRTALSAAGFSPIPSPEKRAKMTLVLKGVDEEMLKEPTNSTEMEILKSAP